MLSYDFPVFETLPVPLLIELPSHLEPPSGEGEDLPFFNLSLSSSE
jgi:hypothetical protein